MLRVIVCLFPVLTVACDDPCDTALKIHHERCVDGDQALCERVSDQLQGYALDGSLP